MEANPYARAAGPIPDASAIPPEHQKQSDYSTAVDKNTDYFLPKFETFDNGGSRIGWNWPAFFITGPYFLYRKMWLAGFLYIFWPLILMIPLGIAAAVMRNLADTFAITGILLYFASWIVLPMYANSFYWSKINKLIADLPRTIASQPDKRARRLENNGGTGIVVPLAVFLFGGLFGGGILAAISIPAFTDYGVRTQVGEGLNLARGAKATVAQFYAQHQSWPASNSEARYSSADGEYTKSITIDRGTVIITYGRSANPKLMGSRLALIPGVDANGGVVWVCGDGPTPSGVTLSDGPRGIEVEEKYLPPDCRATPGAGD
jgi:type IV pilus assembly protein PilA